MRLHAIPFALLAATGCIHEMGPSDDEKRAPARPESFIQPGDDPADEPTEDPTDDPTDDPAEDPPLDVEDPPPDPLEQPADPVIPAQANDSCVVAADCAPASVSSVPGFECVDDTCICDPSGQAASSCAGAWSTFECTCFENTSTAMPSSAAIGPAGNDEEDVVCWWKWRETGCDPDRWVDESYYERVCDAYECWNEYVEDGYYEDGVCYGRWITRCSDGNEYW